MPTATFTADFTKWDAALKNATTNLKSFEVAAGNVGRQLNRAFATFSGEKLIRDANLAVAAVTKLGGVTKLTAAEQARLNATVTEALAKYKALGQSAPADLEKLNAELKQVTASQKVMTAGAQGAGANFGTAVAAYAAGLATFETAKAVITGVVGAVIDFGKASIASFAGAEAAQKKMVVALRAQGQETPEVIDQYNELASTIQKTTAFSDDAASEMTALFITIGNVGPAQMEKATTAATDLAAGLGLELTQAATLVSKALAGNEGALSKYGISLDKARVAAEGADYIFGQIQARFGGQAAAQLETYSGQVAQLANDWDNVQEAVGKMLVTNELTVFALRAIRTELTNASGAAEDLGNTFGSFLQLLGADPTLATYIALLEDYVALLNEASRTARGAVPGTPPPPPAVLPTPLARVPLGGPEAIEAWDKARAAAEAAAKAAKNLREEISGAKTLASIKQMAAAWAGLTASQKASAPTTAALAKFYDALPKDLGKIPPQLKAIVAAGEAASREMGNLKDEYTAIREEVFKLDEILDKLELAADAEEARTVLADILADVAQVGNKIEDAFDLKDQLEETIADIRGVDNAIQEMFEKADEAARRAGKSMGEVFKETFQTALGDIGVVLAQAITTDMSAEDLAVEIGGIIGSAIGFVVAGPVGAKIGDIFGRFLGEMVRTRAEQTQDKVADAFGVAISEGLAQAIEDASARFAGDREAAKLFNLDRIIGEGGGIAAENYGKLAGKLRDVFSLVEQGNFTLEEAQTVLDQNFRTFVDYLGGSVTPALKEIIALNDQFGTQSKAIAEFVDAEARKGLEGIGGFIEMRGAIVTGIADAQKKIAELTKEGGSKKEIEAARKELATFQAQLAAIPLGPEAANAFGGALLGVFDRLTKDGASALQVLKDMTPTIDSLAKQLQQAGIQGGGAFAQLQSMAAIANDTIAGPVLQGISQLGAGLEGLNNANILTSDIFKGITGEITALVGSLQKQGKTMDQIYPFIAKDLQTIFELQQDYGYEVDATTQKLLDEAKAAGVVGDEHRTVQEQMLIAIEEMRDAVLLLAESFGVTLPDDIKKTRDALDQLPKEIPFEYDIPPFPDLPTPPTQEIPTEYRRPRGAPPTLPGTEPAAGYARGGVVYAQRGMWAPRGTDTVPAMLTPGEVVLPRDVVAALRSGGSAPITVNLTITAMDGADVERVVRSPGFRRALTATVRGNDGGVRTDLRADLGVR